MEETAKIDDFKKAKKQLERKQAIEGAVKATGEWFRQNPELGAILVPTVAATGLAIVKGILNISRSAVVTHRMNKEDRSKKMRCYDHSAGHYWNLKRALTNEEWQTIEKKKASGEKLVNVLEELKVLK